MCTRAPAKRHSLSGDSPANQLGTKSGDAGRLPVALKLWRMPKSGPVEEAFAAVVEPFSDATAPPLLLRRARRVTSPSCCIGAAATGHHPTGSLARR